MAIARPRANGNRPIATLVTVPAANHSDAVRHRRPVPWRISTSARNAEAPALAMATGQMPKAAPSTGNSTPYPSVW